MLERLQKPPITITLKCTAHSCESGSSCLDRWRVSRRVDVTDSGTSMNVICTNLVPSGERSSLMRRRLLRTQFSEENARQACNALRYCVGTRLLRQLPFQKFSSRHGLGDPSRISPKLRRQLSSTGLKLMQLSVLHQMASADCFW